MTTEDPGLGYRSLDTRRPPELTALEERMARALALVGDLGSAHADTIRALAAAERRARAWADLAYQMWALIGRSEPRTHVNVIDWGYTRTDLSAKLTALLDGQEAPASADLHEARSLLEYALHLCKHGEKAPGGGETWAEFGRRAEEFLRWGPGSTRPKTQGQREGWQPEENATP